ncbi:MAG: hypothetical protein OXC71_04285, partial [Chloroflexi bacterium]|nr:hypothetical protein [Chloroflexota bacterium]
SLGDQRLGQGREAAKAYLREHVAVAADIEAAVRAAAGVPDPGDASQAVAEAEALATGSSPSGDEPSASGELPLDA